jgi:DNA-binding IclR family transcriptional regulator
VKSESTNTPSTIKSVEKALTMLETFSELEGGINLSRLSEKLGMHKSGVYRLLQVFKQRGYVEQYARNGKYQLGTSAFRVGQNIISNNLLMNKARSLMKMLVGTYNESVYLTLFNTDHVLFFDYVDASSAVGVASLKGRYYPAGDCAAGLVAKAYASTYSSNSEDCPERDRDEFVKIRAQGYCVDSDQLGQGVVSAAVPLLDTNSTVVGSLCIVGPDFRLTDERLRDVFLPPLIEAGCQISAMHSSC